MHSTFAVDGGHGWSPRDIEVFIELAKHKAELSFINEGFVNLEAVLLHHGPPGKKRTKHLTNVTNWNPIEMAGEIQEVSRDVQPSALIVLGQCSLTGGQLKPGESGRRVLISARRIGEPDVYWAADITAGPKLGTWRQLPSEEGFSPLLETAGIPAMTSSAKRPSTELN